jgi:hypothetical protein
VDETSGMSVAFSLEEATEAGVRVADGLALYENALGAATDVIHRVTPDGTEDYVVFAGRPDREELLYEVDVSQVAGLRLIGQVLELLDEGGVPKLRVAPPYLVDATGTRFAGELSVLGCNVDGCGSIITVMFTHT